MLTIEQVKAARELLNWSQMTLARACGIDWTILVEFEAGRREFSPDQLAGVARALKKAGIEFDADQDSGRVKLEQNGVKRATWVDPPPRR
jgi:transcriptional regulator with XRE-family HTH domain